jgi:16S rRNA (adenine1518-N6/adenine1519-N6)-dimethyltransferase
MRAKKSYGQHFLKDEGAALKIINAVEDLSDDRPVVEVGPGKGVLTKYLYQGGKNFKAIEADLDMFDYLHDHYPGIEQHLVFGDFLKIDLGKIYKGEEFVLFGNFPYNISSQILIKMIKYRDRIPSMVGMFQKEVAERIVAAHGSKTYGRISVMIQAYYTGKILFELGPGAFIPPPKVNSTVIILERKPFGTLDCDEKVFKQVVSLAFSQRRKMLRNTLKSLVNSNELLKEDVFTKRPEHLSVEDFIALTNLITKHNSHEPRKKNK